LRLRELTEERAYEAELAECVGVTGYHRWFFLTTFAAALGLRMRAFSVESDAGPLGVIPLLFRRRGPVSTVNYLPVSQIGPVLRGEALRRGQADEMLRTVEPVLRAERAVVTRWAFSQGLDPGASSLAARGFEVSHQESFVVPGTISVADYLKRLAPKQRAAVRRGALRGLTVEPSTRDEITRFFPARLSSGPRPGGPRPGGQRPGGQRPGGQWPSGQRYRGAPGYSLAAARVLAERLADDPRMYWRSVRAADGRTLAVNASIVDTDRLWGWLLVGEPVPGPSPHVAAYWDAVQWSLGRGLACDFGGVPSSGIRDFKVAMGGEAELSAVAERVRPRSYRLVRDLHERLASYRGARAADQPA
jgi:hypothetical protein